MMLPLFAHRQKRWQFPRQRITEMASRCAEDVKIRAAGHSARMRSEIGFKGKVRSIKKVVQRGQSTWQLSLQNLENLALMSSSIHSFIYRIPSFIY